ncbi:RICIN domain-containing protein [Streptomyces anulatus]
MCSGPRRRARPPRTGRRSWAFTARHSGKCLSLPAGGGAQSTALVQRTCDGSPAQSFTLPP